MLAALLLLASATSIAQSISPPPRSSYQLPAIDMTPIKFDAKEVCGRITKGRDSSTWYQAMEYEDSRISADEQAAQDAQTQTDIRLSQPGLTAQQIKTNTAIRKAQAHRVVYDIQLLAFTATQCPNYFAQHQFDGR